MKERPILFNCPMVRAVLDGSKTQTRRVMKPQPSNVINQLFIWKDNATPLDELLALCPYGQPGDRLWVRESFWGCDLPGHGERPCVVYDDEWHGKDYRPTVARPWARKFGRIPSIHMPRDCSRITLEITAVRVERLQDISEEDSVAEGIERTARQWKSYGGPGGFCRSPISSYRSLWESINGTDSWGANPWVWVIEFRRLSS